MLEKKAKDMSRLTNRFHKIKYAVIDSGYKTPWIAKKVIDDGEYKSKGYICKDCPNRHKCTNNIMPNVR